MFSEITGTIDRRILINYRLDPKIAKKLLPQPFQPHIHNGYASVGICLIRFKNMRLFFIPSFLGFKSENAAHRFAVTWDNKGKTETGVYIPRRDTSSRLNSLVGGKLFPGVQHFSKFNINETMANYELSFINKKDNTHLSIDCKKTDDFPANTSMFSSLADSSSFFKINSTGYSPNKKNDSFQGMQFMSEEWRVSPLVVNNVNSSYFNNLSLFPNGSIDFDHALLMENINHSWQSRTDIRKP